LPSESSEGREARPVGSTPTQHGIVVDAARLYFEGTVAAAIMTLLGAISGFATVALTGDARLALLAAGVAFALAGIVLTVHLWRLTRRV
jgi:hypothetical protein